MTKTKEAKSTHTQGPWKIGDRRREDNVLTIVESTGYPSMLATVEPKPHYDDRQEANARLIAAAPELLEACKVALSQEPQGVMTAWGKIVRAAIAKAEGR